MIYDWIMRTKVWQIKESQVSWFTITLFVNESYGISATKSIWNRKMKMYSWESFWMKKVMKGMRNTSILIMWFNIDFIREHQELHEIKKSKAIEEAGIWQVKYYLYYLEERGVKNIKGKIDYPLMKKTLLVELSEQDREKLKSIIDEIESMKKEEFPPKFTEQKICKKCAYHDLCFI